jgi:hypothetical protein
MFKSTGAVVTAFYFLELTNGLNKLGCLFLADFSRLVYVCV